MSAEVTLFRALCWCERSLSIGYSPAYVLHQAAELHQVPAGQLAELLLVKRIESDRARRERDAMQAADAEVDAGPAPADPEEKRSYWRMKQAEHRERCGRPSRAKVRAG